MDLGLDGRVVLVVGGTGYIGRAIVATLRTEGASVVVAGRRAPAEVVMDAVDDASVATGIATVLREHGRLDAVVVTAAPSAGTFDPADNADPRAVLRAVEEKAMVFLRVANAVLPVMREQGAGRLVGISGQNALLTANLRGAVRNAALNVAAKSLADEYAGTGVTVNTVNPGVVADDPVAEVTPGWGGQSSPAQIADLVAFLVSPRAAAISGESIAVGHRVRGVTQL